MTKTMAEEIEQVLMAHRVITDGLYEPTGWCETCGNLTLGDQEAHQAFALSAAGFGLVADAKGEALEDLAEVLKPSGVLWWGDSGVTVMETDRPTRVTKLYDWLRALAAAVRGEG